MPKEEQWIDRANAVHIIRACQSQFREIHFVDAISSLKEPYCPMDMLGYAKPKLKWSVLGEAKTRNCTYERHPDFTVDCSKVDELLQIRWRAYDLSSRILEFWLIGWWIDQCRIAKITHNDYRVSFQPRKDRYAKGDGDLVYHIPLPEFTIILPINPALRALSRNHKTVCPAP